MYIKFCRSYVEDKKDEAKENLSSKLSVELEGEKGKQTVGKARLYRVGCLLLTLLCLVLLLVIIVLSLKLQNGSTVCPEREETAVENRESRSSAPSLAPALAPSLAPTCDYEQCQAYFPSTDPQHLGCQQCANGWLTLGRSCFFLSTYRLSWDQSQRNCTIRGGSLAIITSQEVQNFLTKEGGLKYWIGLRYRGNSWTWVNNTVLQDSYWADDLSSGDCGILSGVGLPEKNWIKAPCPARTYFICQVDF